MNRIFSAALLGFLAAACGSIDATEETQQTASNADRPKATDDGESGGVGSFSGPSSTFGGTAHGEVKRGGPVNSGVKGIEGGSGPKPAEGSGPMIGNGPMIGPRVGGPVNGGPVNGGPVDGIPSGPVYHQ
jgi:hypothetical protein